MSSDKNGAQELPDGWVLCSSKSNPGRKYYFNKKTGKSSWTEPQADDKDVAIKQKGKKEKAKKNEKLKKEEAQRKCMKRKSDSQEDNSVNKKHKQETPTPEKLSPPKQETPKETPPLNKNIANARLSKLRAQLATDIEKEETTEKSPNKTMKHKISPKSASETPPKVPKVDAKSPISNESKSTLSPNDSIQSSPSPSQFFAANKIISSMKAQLPEKYCDKLKKKDTFADIEEGICSQMTEYPFMKHPATPPQFSEASKLVSAIKSKLSYKVTCKDGNIESFHSANDRMNALRSRLSSDLETSIESISKDVCSNDAMEVDCREVIQNVPVMHTKENIVSNEEDLVLVLDTNVFIHELDFIKNVLNSHIRGYQEQPNLLVPWRVINELDRLKDNNNGNGSLCKRAKAAMDYLYKSLPVNSRIKGQSLRDANSHIYPCELPDDEILNCCLQQCERGKSVILVTNDKNLCNKATVNSVKSIGLAELRPLLRAPGRGRRPALAADMRHCRDAVYHLLANILENEMRAKYNSLWQHVLFKRPPWSMDDVLQCLAKHWIAVFSEVFPRVVQHLLADLRAALAAMESKDPHAISQAEVCNFQELCIDIAKKCQIIPEYMELAKLTVERLERRENSNDVAVVEAFEALWTMFSGYSAKLATGLDIPHNLEDNVPGTDPVSVLVERCPAFLHHLQELGSAIQGFLRVSEAGSKADALLELDMALRDSLALVHAPSAFSDTHLRLFCENCRNMLHEASAKFAQLVDVLSECKLKIET